MIREMSGIGTTSPSTKLEVNGDIKTNANLIVNGNVDISASRIKLGLEKSGGGQLVIANNPNDKGIYLEACGSADEHGNASF